MSFNRKRKDINPDMAKAIVEVSKQPKKRIHVIVDAEDYRTLKILAIKQKTTPTEIFNEFIKAYIAKD